MKTSLSCCLAQAHISGSSWCVHASHLTLCEFGTHGSREQKAVMKDDLKCFISACMYLLDCVQCERTKSDRLAGEGYRNSTGS